MKFCLFILLIIMLACCPACSENNDDNPPVIQDLPTVTLDVNTDQTFQTIDGFGFFGARDVWWTGNSENLFTDEWGDRVIRDLGVTIWRNEYFPPSTQTVGQDADWNKQLPVVRGLRDKAAEHGVDLKFIFTVWSPPASLKCKEEDGTRFPGQENEGGTKDGGTLDPEHYKDFGQWLIDGINLYGQEGIDVYAISPQNEPLFRQSFNSCFYTPEWYNEMLTESISLVKSEFPEVKIFSAENMLHMEGGDDRQYFYHQALKANSSAQSLVDINAVHGYNDGVVPTASSQLAGLWTTFREEFGADKSIWMSETSGYSDIWDPTNDTSGALDLALAIHSALSYGNASAWVYWQGSAAQLDEYNLMSFDNVNSKKYNVSKHYYRYIRPGAVRFQTEFSEHKNELFATGFIHNDRNIQTLVLINAGSQAYEVNLSGFVLSDDFDYFLTNQTKSGDQLTEFTESTIYLPGTSVVTLVAGDYFEN